MSLQYNQNLLTYMPDLEEIKSAARVLKLPETMMYKAKYIIQGRFLDILDNGAAIAVSSRDAAKVYQMRGLKQCECPAFQGSPNKTHCKHLQALRVYRSIMRKHLNERIDGSYNFRADQMKNRLNFNTYLLAYRNTALTFVENDHRIPTVVCGTRVRKYNLYDFRNNYEMFRFAIWIAHARTLEDDSYYYENGQAEQGPYINELKETRDFDDYIYMQH